MVFTRLLNAQNSKRVLFYFLSISIVLGMTACGDDDSDGGGGGPDPLVGTYIITTATTTDAILDPVTGADIGIPVGTDMSTALNGALLTAAGCANLANARIELRDNGQIWYVCLTEGTELQNGTWSINSARDQLNLTLQVSGLPFQLIFSNFNETNLTGLVMNVPLTQDVLLAIDPTLNLTSALYLTDLNMALNKD